MKDAVSTPLVMAAIDELEARFKVNLATLIMRVMVKEIAFQDLKEYFVSEFGLSEPMAEQLQLELAGKVFLKVADYLGIDLEALVKQHEQAEVQVAPTAPVNTGVQSSQFFFSTEDEEEIRQLTQKSTTEVPVVAPAGVDLEERLNKVIEKADINFGSEELTNRFRLILRTYLRGIRTKLDTRLTLTKNFEAGGLGFDSDSAENVLNLADQSEALVQAEPIRKPPALPVPEDQLLQASQQSTAPVLGARDVEYSLEKTIADRQAAGLAPGQQVSAPTAQPEPASAFSVPVTAPTTNSEEPETLVIRRPIDSNSKPKVQDIKFVPKTMGPVEELLYMDLTAFRRYEKEPIAIANKIREKIKILENENYGKKLEAVKAWRQSPVQKLYITIGEAAMSKNQPVEIIIQERLDAGEETLTNEEFEVIMNLNRDLRY